MSKIRFVLAGVGAALALVAAAALANVGGLTATNSDSHGDAVSSAARTTCPHGPNGVHGECVSAIASSKSESDDNAACKAADTDEDTSEASAASTEDASEKTANSSKSADKTEDKSEKAGDRAEDKKEKSACEASEASNP
jgi:hypothetical protein